MRDTHDRLDFATASFQTRVPMNVIADWATACLIRTEKKRDPKSPTQYRMYVIADEVFAERVASYRAEKEAAAPPAKVVRHTVGGGSPQAAETDDAEGATRWLTYKEVEAEYGVNVPAQRSWRKRGLITTKEGPQAPGGTRRLILVADDAKLAERVESYRADPRTSDEPDDDVRWLTYTEVAEEYGVNRTTVTSWSDLRRKPDPTYSGPGTRRVLVADDEALAARVSAYHDYVGTDEYQNRWGTAGDGQSTEAPPTLTAPPATKDEVVAALRSGSPVVVEPDPFRRSADLRDQAYALHVEIGALEEEAERIEGRIGALRADRARLLGDALNADLALFGVSIHDVAARVTEHEGA